MLGEYTTSHRCVEVEILRKFSRMNSLNVPVLEDQPKELTELIQSVRERPTQGSLKSQDVDENVLELYLNSLSPENYAKGNEPYGLETLFQDGHAAGDVWLSARILH